MSSTFAAWKDRILFWIITSGVAAIVGWGVWVTMSVSSSPSRREVEIMIQNHAPYAKDKTFIMDHLSRADRTNEKLTTAIENNTAAINLLRVEIARIK